MADAIAILFNNDEDGVLALRDLRTLETAGRLSLADTAVVARNPEGQLYVRNELDSGTETGMTVGALVGALFGPLGLVAGVVGGGAIGGQTENKVDDDFVNEVEQSIGPDRSALFLAIKEAEADALISTFSAYQGRILRSTLSTDAEEVLNLALSEQVTEDPLADTQPEG
ncbi:MAG TPA: DUF1269 domain-containing protein [Thermomicrobiales bacterium]|jgi:uncharacterized membrane protein|nr:DUF1269 domain-containing protein [Thermomicrobiales bacterium]